MPEGQTERVKGLTMDGTVIRIVQKISRQWMPDVLHVHPDLMGSSGFQTDSGKGKIYLQEDGTKIIRYQAETADSHTWQLDYNLNAAGTVTSIDMRYIP